MEQTHHRDMRGDPSAERAIAQLQRDRDRRIANEVRSYLTMCFHFVTTRCAGP